VLACGLAVLLPAPRALVAQGSGARWEGSADAGYVHVRQVSQIGASVTDGASLAGLLARTTPRLTLIGSGTAVAGTDGSAVALGLVSGAWRPVTRGGWQIELGTILTALGSTDLSPSYGGSAYARQQHVTVATHGFRGAWAGAGVGALDDDLANRRALTADAGAVWGWRARGSSHGALTAAVTHTRLRLGRIPVTPDAYIPAESMHYTDATLALRWTLRRLEVDAAAGVRVGEEPSENPLELNITGTRRFGSLAASWWVRPRTALVVGAGRALADQTRGTARARYVTAGLRLALGATRATPATPVVRAARTSGPTVSAERVAGGVLLRVVALSAQQVELMGDFTEWQPIALTRGDDGVWARTLAIVPGSIRLVVRLDGGEWTVPANVPATRDGFGGTVGLVVVP
jgi:hypothetical protein